MIERRDFLAAPTVVLVGGSVRAAAFSALRAGLTPWCLDLFADVDLQAAATVERLPLADYPHGLPALLAQAPPGPLVYTGALENYPQLIETIANDRPVWGNDSEALRRSRDPFFVAHLLDMAGIPRPTVSREA